MNQRVILQAYRMQTSETILAKVADTDSINVTHHASSCHNNHWTDVRYSS